MDDPKQETPRSDDDPQDLVSPGAGEHVSFIDRLQARIGRDLDPGIQLQEESEEDASRLGAAARGGTESKGTHEGGSRSASSGSSTHSGRRLIEKLADSVHLSSRYRVSDELARGGMGTILRVWDDDLRRNLAMKVMHGVARTGSSSRGGGPDEERLVRFLEEAQITGQLDHPGVVPVHDLGIDPKGRCYFTMRLVKGRELKEILRLARDGAEGWTLTRALNIVLKVCEAMAFAHSKSVVHRDLKPSNVMVGRFGETYVMDWGLARVLGKDDSLESLPQDASSLSIVRTDRRDTELDDPESPLVTLDGDVVGTPSYMAPEQARGDLGNLGPRADVYSLGAILYELLTGRVPYLRPDERVSPHQVLSRVLDGPPEPVAKLARDQPAELVAICEKAMARDQSQRYPSMLAVAEDLQAFLEDRVVQAYGGGALVEIQKWVVRNKGAAAALGALLLVAAVSAIGFNLQKSRQFELLSRKEAETSEAKGRAEEAAIQANSARLETEAALSQAQASERAALESEGRARRSSYGANLMAAVYSLRLGSLRAAQERLEACSEDMRGWEWWHLELERQPTLRQRRVSAFRGDRALQVDGGERVFLFTQPGIAQVLDYETLENTLENPINTSGMEVSGAVLSAQPFDTRSSVALHPDGETLALYSNGTSLFVRGLGPEGVRPISVEAWAEEAKEAHQRRVRERKQENLHVGDRFLRSLAWSPDGTSLIAGAFDGSILLFDATEDYALRILNDRHRDAVLGLAWDPNGRRFASVSKDGEFALWNPIRGGMVERGREHEGPATDIVFDPRRGSYVSCGRDGALLRWGARGGRFEATVARVGEPLQAVAVRGRTGSLAAVSAPYSDTIEGRVFLVEPVGEINSVVDFLTSFLSAERTRVRTLLGAVSNLQDVFFSADGRSVGAYGDEGIFYLWDIEGPLSRTQLSRAMDPERFHDMRSADPISLAWNGRAEHGAVQGALSPDGTLAATSGAEGDVLLWDLETGYPRQRLRGHEAAVESVAFSPDGQLLASGARDRVVRLWNTETGSLVRVLRGEARWINQLHFSRDGSRLFCSGGENEVQVWDVASGTALPSMGGGDLPQGLVTALSPDDELLALGSREIVVIDTATNAECLRIPRRSGRVLSLGFTTDGRALWAGYSNGTLRKWSLETEELLVERNDHVGFVFSILLTNDGERLFTSGRDATLAIRDPETGDVLLSLELEQNVRQVSHSETEGLLLLVQEDGTARLLESIQAGRGRVEERRAARAEVRDLRDTLLPQVKDLLAQRGYPSEARAALRADPRYSAAEREVALALLDVEIDIPGYLGGLAREALEDREAEDPQLLEALARVEAARELAPSDLELLGILGLLQLRLGQQGSALETLTEVLGSEGAGDLPDDVALSVNYGLILAMLGTDATERLEEIRARAQQLLAANPALRVRPQLAEMRAEVDRALESRDG